VTANAGFGIGYNSFFMAMQEWFDFEFIRHVFRHVSGTIVVVLLFAITAWLVKTVGPSGVIRNRIDQVDGVVVYGLLCVLAIQLVVDLIKHIWKQLRGGWNGAQVLAF
jgi:hypothetical protein